MEGWLGHNKQSWSLSCSPDKYNYIHENEETELTLAPSSSTIGVYVHHSAGILSFYSVSGNTVILLHTVQTTFTQPLYPGFWLNTRSKIKLKQCGTYV